MIELIGPLFVAASTGALSPGPNNLICLDLGKTKGLKNSFPYIVGAFIGYTGLLFLVSLFSSILIGTFPIVKKYIGFLGASYLSYMAFNLIFRSNSPSKKKKIKKNRENWRLFSFALFFQYINPKAWVFSLSILPTFAFIETNQLSLWSLFVISVLSFMTLSGLILWSMFGVLIEKHLHKYQKTFNYSMAFLLIFSAYNLIK